MRILLLLLIALVGCGDNETPKPDGGPAMFCSSTIECHPHHDAGIDAGVDAP